MQFERKRGHIARVQTLLRTKLAEMTFTDRAQDVLDELDAELEVYREMEEEKRRAEEAKRKARKDRIRAQVKPQRARNNNNIAQMQRI